MAEKKLLPPKLTPCQHKMMALILIVASLIFGIVCIVVVTKLWEGHEGGLQIITTTTKPEWVPDLRPGWRSFVDWTGIISVIAAVATLAFTVIYHERMDSWLKAFILGFWALLPPIYFYIEFSFIFAAIHNESLSNRQEREEKIWAALVLVLGAIYFKKAEAVGEE